MEQIDELLIQQYEMLKSMDELYLKQMKTLQDRLAKKGGRIEDSNSPNKTKVYHEANHQKPLEMGYPHVVANKLKPLPPLNKN